MKEQPVEKLIFFSVICLATMQSASASNWCYIEESSANSSSDASATHTIRLNQNAISKACKSLIATHFKFKKRSNIITLLAANEQTATSLVTGLRSAISTFEATIADDEVIKNQWQQFKSTFSDYKYGANFELSVLLKILDGSPYSPIRKELKTIYAEKQVL